MAANRTGWTRLAWIGLAAVLAASCTKSAGRASGGGAPTSAVVSVPFVGCAQDGQGGPIAAPTGAPRAVSIDAGAAQRLAYYGVATSGGVLAPRGWHCFGIYGSSGSSLFVTPQPLTGADLLSAAWGGLTGPAVQSSVNSGDTSGRFEVAAIMARVFPARGAFVRKVIGEGVEPASAFPSGAYPGDTLKTVDDRMVEFQTAPNSAGLGVDHTRLKASGDPIAGVAILTGPTPDVTLAAVRLSPGMTDLAPAIIRQVELDNAPASGGRSPAAALQAPAASAVDVARAFYAALAKADGAAASGLVVPEKRQSGPFSAPALTGFYASLRQPLRLTAASLASDGSVSVRYAYVFANGKTCDGAARVTTIVRGGERLISAVQAPSGC